MTSNGTFTASWRAISIVLSVVAVASITTLVVVVATKNVDLLSTVALLLAVIAFVAQLLIYIAQSAAASQQMQQMQDINRQTESILSDIQARAQGSETALKDHFDKLLSYALDPSTAGDRPPRVVTSGTASPSRKRPLVRSSHVHPQPAGAELEEIRSDPLWEALSTTPDEKEARLLFAAIDGLTALAFGQLVRYAVSLRQALVLGTERSLKLRQHHELSDELNARGFVHITQDTGGRSVGSLTVQGMRIASLLMAEGDNPDYLTTVSSRHIIHENKAGVAEQSIQA